MRLAIQHEVPSPACYLLERGEVFVDCELDRPAATGSTGRDGIDVVSTISRLAAVLRAGSKFLGVAQHFLL